MKKCFYPLLLLLAIMVSACGHYQQEIWINKDGSGKISNTMEISEMLSLFQMMSELEDMEVEEEEPSSDVASDAVDNLISKVIDGEEIMDFDTLVDLESFMPDSLKGEIENPEDLKKLQFGFHSSSKDSIVNLIMNISFQDTSEIARIVNAMSKLDKDKINDENQQDLMDMFLGFTMHHDKGIFIIDPYEMNEEEKKDLEEMSQDEEFINEFFGDARYIYNIHFPGKVLSISDETFVTQKTDDNVIISFSMIDLLKSGSFNGCEIKYEKN